MFKASIKSLSVCSLIFCCLVSCSEKDEGSLECIAMIPQIKIDFNIVNPEGTDLFFSPDASLQADSLQIYRSQTIDLFYPVAIEGEIDKYFSFDANGTERDTCYLQFSGTDIDTLIYVGSPDPTSECPRLKLDTVYYNGVVSARNQDTGIFKFIKSP